MPVSLKQTPVTAAASSGTATPTFGANTTVGSKLIAICTAVGAVQPTTPSGWTLLGTQANGTSIQVTIFELTKVTTAATAYPFAGFNSTNGGNVALYELAGADTNTTAYITSLLTQSTGTTVTTPTLYALVTGSMFLAGFGAAGNGSSTDSPAVSSGWTASAHVQNGDGCETYCGYILAPTVTSTIVPTPFTFKPTGSTGTTFVPFGIVVNPVLGSGSAVSSIALTPATPTVTAYAQTQMTATATLADSSTANLLGYATFSATNGTFAQGLGYGTSNQASATTVVYGAFQNGSGIYTPSGAMSAAGAGATDTINASYAGVSAPAKTITVTAIAVPTAPTPGANAQPVATLVPTRSVAEVPVFQGSREMDQGTYTSGGSGDLGGTGAIVMAVNIPANGIRFLFANYTNINGAGESTSSLSTLTFKASVQYPADSGTPVALTFNGSRTASLDPGGYIYSDPVDLTTLPLAANLTGTTVEVGVRTFVQVASGGTFPVGPHGQNYSAGVTGPLYGLAGVVGLCTGTAGDNYPQNNSGAGTDQTLTTGLVSAWYSTNNGYTFGPLAAVGTPIDGVNRPVVSIVGDSISNGSIDTLVGSSGFQVRALCAAGLPYYMMARGNESFSSFIGALAQRRMLRVNRSTHAIIDYGANDMLSLSFATMRTNCLTVVQQVASRNVITYLCTLLPRFNQTTPPAYTFPAFAQIPQSYESVRQSFNAWLRAPASAGAGASAIYDIAALGITTFAGVFDTASLIEVDANNSFSLTGGHAYAGAQNNTSFYADTGTHPSTAGHTLIAAAILTSKIIAAPTALPAASGPHFFP